MAANNQHTGLDNNLVPGTFNPLTPIVTQYIKESLCPNILRSPRCSKLGISGLGEGRVNSECCGSDSIVKGVMVNDYECSGSKNIGQICNQDIIQKVTGVESRRDKVTAKDIPVDETLLEKHKVRMDLCLDNDRPDRLVCDYDRNRTIMESKFDKKAQNIKSVQLDIDTNNCKSCCTLSQAFNTLSLPPRFTTVRVNFLCSSLSQTQELLEQYLVDQYKDRHVPPPTVYSHSLLPDLLVLECCGESRVTPVRKQVVVSKMCGSSVLRGAQVFAPGVMGLSPKVRVGDMVAVFADLDDTCLRGSKVFSGRKMFLGNGTAQKARRDLFVTKECTGVAVSMKEQLYQSPSLGSCFQDRIFLQNLPSVVCGHVLKHEKDCVVLDMCAAPGGKTTHIATLMCNTGKVIAVDRSQSKVGQIIANAEKLGLTNIKAYKYDSTKLVLNEINDPLCYSTTNRQCTAEPDSNSKDKSLDILDSDTGSDNKGIQSKNMEQCSDELSTDTISSNSLINDEAMANPFSSPIIKNISETAMNFEVSTPPFPPSSFQYILLDAPCSALGQRPQLSSKTTLKEVRTFPVVQRRLFQNAVELLQPGGRLVYSTCTIVPHENEMMVKWALDRFSEIVLVDCGVELGMSGLSHCGLDEEECKMVRRFGPDFSFCIDDCFCTGSTGIYTHNPEMHIDSPEMCTNETETCVQESKANVLDPETPIQDTDVHTQCFKNSSVDEDTIGFFIAAFTKIVRSPSKAKK